MTIESIVRGIDRELVPVFEEKLRAALADRDREWLIDQVASTELAAGGTWQGPDSVSHDERADNVLLEVQYG